MKSIKTLGLICCVAIAAYIYIYIYAANHREINASSVLPEPIHYRYTPDAITVDYSSNLKSYGIQFSYNGINKLMGISQINVLSDTSSLTIKASTDWIGPYVVEALDTDSFVLTKEQFTGGWHGSNGDCTGQPTAVCKSVELLVNSKHIHQGATPEGYANGLQIKVVNWIKAYNTSDYIIEETITYTLRQNAIQIHTQITALKACVIHRYYGLQTQNTVWANQVKYTFTDQSEILVPSKEENNSGSPHNTSLAAFTVTSDQLEIAAWMDPSVGLGSFEYLSQSLPYAFTTEYGKTYFNLINGKELILEKDESIEWCGGYEIK